MKFYTRFFKNDFFLNIFAIIFIFHIYKGKTENFGARLPTALDYGAGVPLGEGGRAMAPIGSAAACWTLAAP